MSARWDYNNKLILVTGSTKGIGKAIAEEYYIAKGTVIIHGRKQNDIEKVIKDIKNKYNKTSNKNENETKESDSSVGKLYGFAADLCKTEDIKKLESFINNIGHLDVLINNAGAFFAKEFVDTTDEDWLKLFDVNVLSGVRLSRIYLPKMLEKINDKSDKRKGGNIVFISSEAGIRGLPQMIHYSSTKAAQLNIARSLAKLTKGIPNVRVNSILPGPTWTEGVELYMKGVAKSENCSLEEVIKNYFIKYENESIKNEFLQPKEIADTCLFLTSDLASGINGTSQKCEGGIINHIA